MFMRSLYDPLVADIMPDTVAALGQWDGTGLPPEQVFALTALELDRAREEKTIGKLATRLNRDTSGLRSVVMRTGRGLKRAGGPPWSESLRDMDKPGQNEYPDPLNFLTDINPAWGEPAIWQALARTGARVTPVYYLNAVDLTFGSDGGIVRQAEERRIYTSLLHQDHPGQPDHHPVVPGNRLPCGLPDCPFAAAAWAACCWCWCWCRSGLHCWCAHTSWIVLLQQQGVVNDLLVWLGLIPDEQRLTMIHNMTGTLVAMTHVLLPFMILPVYSVMRGIPAVQMQAAMSLGASWPRAFCRVYLPQSLPGVGAGCLLVFILAIGYYITPALVGGQSGQLISNFIAYHIQTSLNWGLAAALGCVLFIAVLLLFLLYDRVLGLDRMKLG